MEYKVVSKSPTYTLQNKSWIMCEIQMDENVPICKLSFCIYCFLSVVSPQELAKEPR